MALSDGDVIRFDYTLWIQGQDRPLETSREEVAKEHAITREKTYRPLTVTLGSGQLLPGLESHIRSHGKKGEKVTVELAARDAYGDRDPSKIRDIPMAQFRKQGVKPEVGLVLNLQDQRGVVTRVAGGRVRVDTNHDLAGKDLRYEYQILEVVTDPKEKVAAVLKALFGDDPPENAFDDGVVSLEVPPQLTFNQEWPMQKLRLVQQLRNAAGDGVAIRLVETFPGRVPGEGHSHEGHSHEGHGHEGHSHEEE